VTLMMSSAQVVKTSVNGTTNSPSQDYTHPDDHTSPTHKTLKFALGDLFICACAVAALCRQVQCIAL